ncbi:MAG: hypothetical protein M1820_002453 [Bogoriella megaspora]|nr:MAG: hypothetical protein M1820_002453 [Bogoriella megaspora]
MPVVVTSSSSATSSPMVISTSSSVILAGIIPTTTSRVSSVLSNSGPAPTPSICMGSNNTQFTDTFQNDYTILCDYDSSGTGIGNVTSQPSVDDCIDFCSSTVDCLAVAYVQQGGTCYLKSNEGTLKASPGLIFAIRTSSFRNPPSSSRTQSTASSSGAAMQSRSSGISSSSNPLPVPAALNYSSPSFSLTTISGNAAISSAQGPAPIDTSSGVVSTSQLSSSAAVPRSATPVASTTALSISQTASCPLITTTVTGAALSLGSITYTAISGQPLTVGTTTISLGGTAVIGYDTLSLGTTAIFENLTRVPFSPLVVSTCQASATPSVCGPQISTVIGAAFVFNSLPYTATSGFPLILSSGSVNPGGPPQTVDGHTLSLGTSALVEDGSIIPFSTFTAPPVVVTGAVFTLGNNVYTATSSLPLTFGASVLSLGSPAQTISGHTFSLGSAGLVEDGKILSYSAIPLDPMFTGAIFTLDGSTYTVTSGQSLAIGSATILPYAQPQTVAAATTTHAISLGPNGVVLDNSLASFSAICPTPTAAPPAPIPAPNIGPNPAIQTQGAPLITPAVSLSSLIVGPSVIIGNGNTPSMSQGPLPTPIPSSSPNAGDLVTATQKYCHECEMGTMESFGAGGFLSTSVVSTYVQNATLGLGCACSTEILQTCSRVAVVKILG